MEQGSKRAIIDMVRKSGRRYEVYFGWFAKGENKCKGVQLRFRMVFSEKKGISSCIFSWHISHTWTGDFGSQGDFMFVHNGESRGYLFLSWAIEPLTVGQKKDILHFCS